MSPYSRLVNYLKSHPNMPQAPRPVRPRPTSRKTVPVLKLKNLPPNVIREIGRHLSFRNRDKFSRVNKEQRRTLQPNLNKNLKSDKLAKLAVIKSGILTKLAVLKTKLRNAPNQSTNYYQNNTNQTNREIRKITADNITTLEKLVNNKTKSFNRIGNKNLFLKVGYGGKITVAKRDKTYTPRPNRGPPVYSYKSGYEVNNHVNKLTPTNLIYLGRNRVF